MEDHWSDWWVAASPVVGLLDLALYLVLQARPGPTAIALWTWGPPVIVATAAALLAAALLSAYRTRLTWSWRRMAGLAGICAIIATSGVYQTYPSSHDDQPSRVVFRLPLDGPVTVAWGGPTLRTNYHVGSPAERWGYDFVVTVDGRSHTGDGSAVDEHYAYGRDVHAPADGTVVTAHDGEPDATPGRPDRDRRAGNHIVLDVAPREYLFIAHLQPGSVLVTAGQRVRQGEVVARVGNSGNTSEPHVHLHLQDSATPDRGEGIPLYFSGYRVEGVPEVVQRGLPIGGQRNGVFLGQIVEFQR